MIRNIWAVGRNYSEHAAELGNTVPQQPMIFLKAGSSALFGHQFELPTWSERVDHELELAFKFDEQLQLSHWALALDLTERVQQTRLKSQGLPWTLAKSFTGSCPISDFAPVGKTNLASGRIELLVNGKSRQLGDLSQMIFPIEKLRSYVLAHFPVVEGDLLLTGTPAGVGPLSKGDHLEAFIAGRSWHWQVL